MATTSERIQKLLKSDLSLSQQRLVIEDNSYSDAFPTSPAAQAAREWGEALVEFEAAHPEIVAAIKAKEATKREADHAELAKKDLLGM